MSALPRRRNLRRSTGRHSCAHVASTDGTAVIHTAARAADRSRWPLRTARHVPRVSHRSIYQAARAYNFHTWAKPAV